MIKYRVYDTEDKEYLDSFRTAVTPDGEVFVLSDYKYNDDGQEIWEAKLVCSARQEPGRFIIEQYTGLKDKNGVEIAEGDIVAIKHDDWDIQELRQVKYYGQFGYPAFDFSPSFDDVENGLSIVTQSDFYSVEVIGNIHENAELLEERK